MAVSPKSCRGAWRGWRAVTAGLVLALAVQMAGPGVPAYADDNDDISIAEMRDLAVFDLVEGGPSVRRAAETALVGTDQEIRSYYETGFDTAQEADERAAAQVLAGMDGPAMRSAALAALEKPRAEMRAFVTGGWSTAWNSDERLRVYRLLDSGGTTVRSAAQQALDGDAAAIDKFLSSGRDAAEHADDRLAATRMLTGAPNNSGPVLNTAAQQALNGTPEELKEFLRWGQFTARARDAELASVRSLTEQARQAGLTTAREALAAEESAVQAGNAAAEAKKAAKAADDEARAAQGDAKKASAAAGRAADAAQRAAEASREAVAASNAAMRAARVAADASRKATTAAALTAQAASRAQRAAAAARLNAGDARLAREAAETARDAARMARELTQVKAERDKALAKAAAAAVAAKQAGANADAAGVAADEAGRQSGVSAHQAQRARNAAAQARRAAATADRAADRAESLARQAKEASDQAFALAQSAAEHAENAVTQARLAADAADRGEISAAEAAKHAQAAVNASNVAVEAANRAIELEALARAEDQTRLAEWTEQGVQAAQTALETEQAALAAGGELTAWNRSLLWDTAEQDRINAATKALLAEATAAGASTEVVMDRGRRAALALVTTGGEWTKQAARDALAGDEAELRLWLSQGRRTAAGQDDRARLWRLVDTLPDGAEKTAAQTALNGDDAVVENFLRTRNYPGKVTKDRQLAYQIVETAGTYVNLKTAAERALGGTPAELHQFLRTGQHTARAADERQEVYRVMEGAGPEVQAAAKVALAGPSSYLSYFLTTGLPQAHQRDLEQAAHVATVSKLIAEAQQYAQKALEDADRAVEAAKRAQGYANEANAAKTRADNAARRATEFANQAAASANAAKQSADQAAQSAVTARNAANSARASANAAARSAATATAAAQRAQADAQAAFRAKREARASAEAAGKDAAQAADAAKEATLIYLERLEQAEKDRRSTAPGSGPNGEGTAADNHKTWGCLSIDPSSVSKECLSVFKDFAEALMDSAKCSSPEATSAGCQMLGDLKKFVGENEEVLLDMLQFTLMACGLVPGAGEACDAIDAAVSFGRGDWAGGLLSAGAAVPVLGWFATGGKAWKNSDKLRNIKNIIEKLKRNDSCPVPIRNSFAPGTRVLLADGRTKEIEKVRVGDAVVATDPVGRHTAVKAVTATTSDTGTKRLIDVGIDEDGDPHTAPAIISATPEHPFWVPSRRAWVTAGALVAGSTVLTRDGDPAVVATLSVRTETTSVYNFTVAGLHTYYVMAHDEPVLVHNACSRTSGNNPAARNGTAIHGDFSTFLNGMGNGYSGARTLSTGRKIDGEWFDPNLGKNIPIELKPNNYSQIRKGWNQLDQYEKDMGAPAGSGQLWVYDVGPGGQIYFTRVL
ncbi:polymorphic toxin-type HINT domain-containing protein [Jidongwangia harbinensis]|uniref:polymorphic toxin-type HINT domain-containing protein n=1 Tax=Jidongwangia harbinensis TaxID=2878561 RepID=UPI001CD955A2|nr:polymorphic toxin-type HINT domain-containing protein [Jidongwangia harbinensis]MCA2218708.1 hypothetical protein [Jidongwangia harbinensis]